MALKLDPSILRGFNWAHDWTQFVAALAVAYEPIVTNTEPSAKIGSDQLAAIFDGKQVFWEGRLQDMNLRGEYGFTAGFGMPLQELSLCDKKILRATRLVISIEPYDVATWAVCTVGDDVRYKACITPNKLGRPSIEYAIARSPDRPVQLRVRLAKAIPLEIRKGGAGPFVPVEPVEPKPAEPKPRIIPTEEYPSADNEGSFFRLGQLENRLISEQKMPEECWQELEDICVRVISEVSTAEMITRFITFLERVPDEVNLGSPGVVIHALENTYPEYLPELKESLQRQPNGNILSLAEPVTSKDKGLLNTWRPIYESVLKNPNASVSAREIVQMIFEDD